MGKAKLRLLYARERYPVPICRRLGEPHSLSGRARKISPPPGLDPRNVQPGVSGYTDYAIPAHANYYKDTFLYYTHCSILGLVKETLKLGILIGTYVA